MTELVKVGVPKHELGRDAMTIKLKADCELALAIDRIIEAQLGPKSVAARAELTEARAYLLEVIHDKLLEMGNRAFWYGMGGESHPKQIEEAGNLRIANEIMGAESDD